MIIRTAKRLASDRSGSVMTIFGLAFIPTMLGIGLGVDYARATTERAMLQSGVDAAALAGILEIRKGETVVQVTPIVNQIVAANDTNPVAYVSNINLSSNGTTLCVSAKKSNVPTTIMAIGGYTSLAIGVTACSAMRLDTYEIAFAMDNSASMANSAQSGGQTKMQAAQQAANALIQALAPGSNGASGVPTNYAVVPFSSSVNVGSSYLGASWLDGSGQSSIHWKDFTLPAGVTRPQSLFAMLKTMGVAWGGCVEERPAPYTATDTQASSGTPDTLFVPFFWPDEVDTNPYGSSYNQLTFNNYVGDQTGSCTANDAYATADKSAPGRGDGQTKLCKYTKAIASTSNKYYVTGQTAGPNAGCATPALQPLNATQSVTTSSINAMTPIGDTVLATGFMWAWRAISPNGPFDAGGNISPTTGQQAPKAYGYINPNTTAVNHKVIILLTDGMDDWFGQDNDGYTQYTAYDPNKMVYNGFGYPQDSRLGTTTTSNARSLLDNTLATACTNAKATTDPTGKSAPVEIYTVGFLATDGIDQAGQTLLANCATDSAHTFIATTGTQLVQVFQQIAASITQPRIAN